MFTRAQPSQAAWERLASQMGGLVKGCSLDLVTWLVSCLLCDPDEGRDLVGKLVWDYCCLGQLEPWLRRVEEDQRIRSIGPRSKTCGYNVRPPYPGATSMEEGVLKYFTVHSTSLHPPSFRAARDALFSLIRKGSIKPLGVVQAALDFKKRANCGWPEFVRAVESPFEYLSEAERLLNDGLNRIHAPHYPGSLGTRTDVRGRGMFGKSRVIFGISRVTNILNGMVFAPIYNRLWQLPHFVAWVNRAAVDREVSRIIRTRRVMYSIDFSGFDASVPNEVIDVIFDAIAYWLAPGNLVLNEFIRDSFKYTGIYVPGSVEYYHGENRMGGVPSGSKLTNLVDSLVNFFVMHYVAHRAKCQVMDICVQGDDALVTFNGFMTKEKLAYYCERDLGMRLSSEKTSVDRDYCSFLQMNYHRSYRLPNGVNPGVRSIMRSIGRMMSREHSPAPEPDDWGGMHPDLDWSELMDSFRAIQQVDYCSGHPSFKKFADWTADHHPRLSEAMRRILTNDVALLTKVSSVLQGDPSKSRLTDLYESPVVQYLATRRSWM